MTLWTFVRWLHELGMAVFVGGQILLAGLLAPVLRGRPEMKRIARGFGWATLGALAVLIATGVAMAGHFSDWGRSALHWKLGLLALVIVLLGLHARFADRHLLSAAILVASLAIAWFGVDLAHGA